MGSAYRGEQEGPDRDPSMCTVLQNGISSDSMAGDAVHSTSENSQEGNCCPREKGLTMLAMPC